METTGDWTESEEGVDRVERAIELEIDAAEAWAAISDPAVLERWLADEVDLRPVEGAPIRFRIDGELRPGRVERVREGRELSFTWHREPGRTSLVELELEPCVSGIRLRVIETSFDLVPPPLMHAWARPMAGLSSLFAPVGA
jgi:uncharacterized protein YndB with AHSA1/START domain